MRRLRQRDGDAAGRGDSPQLEPDPAARLQRRKCITASFGVTEVQLGDTPETMLARADRALYDAKEGGRNTVVQLGTGIGGGRGRPCQQPRQAKAKKARSQPSCLAEQHLVTTGADGRGDREAARLRGRSPGRRSSPSTAATCG